MARLFPAGDHGNNEWENRVFSALKNQLGDDFTVYVNVFMAGRRLGAGIYAKQHAVLHESDCVIVSPKHGVLLLEVKGPSLEALSNGNWIYRNGANSSPAENPFRQVTENLDALKKHMNKALGSSTIPFPYGFAIAFPGHKFPSDVRPMWYSPTFVYLKDDITRLGEKVLASFKEWNQFQSPKSIPLEVAKEIGKILRDVRVDSKATEYVPIERFIRPMIETKLDPAEVETRDIRGTDLKFDNLTRDQAEVVFAAEENPRILVRGMAGSGKTVIAVDHACRLADRGLQVLLLCYNTALGEHLDKRVANYPLVRAGSFYEFVNETLRRAGMKVVTDADDGYWEDLPAVKLEEAIGILKAKGEPLQFDALVVDEGQDFHPEWWIVLEDIVRETNLDGIHAKRLAVFFDPLQNLFSRKATENGEPILPDAVLNHCARLRLRHNCRNTKSIAKYIEMWTGELFPCMPGLPDGKTPVFHDMRNNWQSSTRALENLIAKLIEEGFELKDIAIARFHSAGQPLAINGVQTTPDIARWNRGEAILYTTVRKFKGLEANALILFDIPEPGSESSYSRSDHYVAISRARQELALFVRTSFRKPEKPIEPQDYGPMDA